MKLLLTWVRLLLGTSLRSQAMANAYCRAYAFKILHELALWKVAEMGSSRWTEIGRKTMLAEAEAIITVAGLLDKRFEDAVNLLLSSNGRIVVLGLGKSGHVGRKIAATLASTGTPAFFVHAAEAFHGDFGMITAEDVVLAISNSGETAEVVGAVSHIRKIGARIVALTGNAESSLAVASDAVLHCPVQREADPLDLAPTSSSTATLALGDAVAVALMIGREFDAQGFAAFHPGGSLGKKLSAENVGSE